MPLATPLPFTITNGQGIVPYNNILISQMTLRYSTLQKTQIYFMVSSFQSQRRCPKYPCTFSTCKALPSLNCYAIYSTPRMPLLFSQLAYFNTLEGFHQFSYINWYWNYSSLVYKLFLLILHSCSFPVLQRRYYPTVNVLVLSFSEFLSFLFSDDT